MQFSVAIARFIFGRRRNGCNERRNSRRVSHFPQLHSPLLPNRRLISRPPGLSMFTTCHYNSVSPRSAFRLWRRSSRLNQKNHIRSSFFVFFFLPRLHVSPNVRPHNAIRQRLLVTTYKTKKKIHGVSPWPGTRQNKHGTRQAFVFFFVRM